jgi:ATP synthase protein I
LARANAPGCARVFTEFQEGAEIMQSGVRNIVIAQLILTAAVAVAFFAWQGQGEALSALYGGAIVLLNSFLLARRIRRTSAHEGKSIALAMYAGAAQRFVTTLVAFAVGMGVLKLAPLPQIIAFAVAQLGYVIAAQRQ